MSQLKVDKHGVVLVPQPSDHVEDPLNWPYFQKVYVVGLVSMLGFMAQVSASLANPAFNELAKNLHVSIQQASYCTTVWILFAGVTPMFMAPFANVYGRRNLFVVFTLIAAAANIGSAGAKSYGGLVVGRIFNGIGSSVPLGFGAAIICDLFYQGQRGFYMGIYVLAVTNGPHISPIFGGYVSQNLGWRWCFWIPAIIQGALWVLVVFTLPETLFSRQSHNRPEKRSYTSKLLFTGRILDRKIHLSDYAFSFRMTKYAAITIPCIYYMTGNGYGSTIFAVTGSHISSNVYGFDTKQTGLFMGIPLTIGCMIGEAAAGWISDLIVNLYARRHGGVAKPEVRLFLLPLCPIMAVGTATYGYCIQLHRPWIESSVCMAVAGLGCQLGNTVVYTYCTDSYKPQSGEVGAIINLFKSIFAFNVGFYALPFSNRNGYDVAFAVVAAINLSTILPLVFMLFKGEKIREKQGIPAEHESI
ncbi:major facilitator superfamily domain-containing protein [Talaromyces proteolyticus]|uniref:Major facilitator superfamily domain-containing protein n=1 Tax=Talaromyces proteolyticus TaxID=1131652 RepID=A0AAD4Q2X1_9EURO|nr:major facilitator superfamily domain-containing protein [Talaromyces proteolyticus]KAH8700821.1 major facilitator superfamily domain-containing protein [Talaromyces proteolyticus]